MTFVKQRVNYDLFFKTFMYLESRLIMKDFENDASGNPIDTIVYIHKNTNTPKVITDSRTQKPLNLGGVFFNKNGEPIPFTKIVEIIQQFGKMFAAMPPDFGFQLLKAKKRLDESPELQEMGITPSKDLYIYRGISPDPVHQEIISNDKYSTLAWESWEYWANVVGIDPNNVAIWKVAKQILPAEVYHAVWGCMDRRTEPAAEDRNNQQEAMLRSLNTIRQSLISFSNTHEELKKLRELEDLLKQNYSLVDKFTVLSTPGGSLYALKRLQKKLPRPLQEYHLLLMQLLAKHKVNIAISQMHASACSCGGCGLAKLAKKLEILGFNDVMSLEDILNLSEEGIEDSESVIKNETPNPFDKTTHEVAIFDGNGKYAEDVGRADLGHAEKKSTRLPAEQIAFTK